MYYSNLIWYSSTHHLLDAFVTVQEKDNLKQQLLIESIFIISAHKDLGLAISISITSSSIILFSYTEKCFQRAVIPGFINFFKTFHYVCHIKEYKTGHKGYIKMIYSKPQIHLSFYLA